MFQISQIPLNSTANLPKITGRHYLLKKTLFIKIPEGSRVILVYQDVSTFDWTPRKNLLEASINIRKHVLKLAEVSTVEKYNLWKTPSQLPYPIYSAFMIRAALTLFEQHNLVINKNTDLIKLFVPKNIQQDPACFWHLILFSYMQCSFFSICSCTYLYQTVYNVRVINKLKELKIWYILKTNNNT